jgi:hypothetical protein
MKTVAHEAVAKDSSVECPRCKSHDTRLSTQWEPSDALMRALLRKPWRCLRCFKRFYVFQWHGVVRGIKDEP